VTSTARSTPLREMRFVEMDDQSEAFGREELESLGGAEVVPFEIQPRAATAHSSARNMERENHVSLAFRLARRFFLDLFRAAPAGDSDSEIREDQLVFRLALRIRPSRDRRRR